jgi:hypothetical protein
MVFDNCPPAGGLNPAIWRLDPGGRLIRRYDAAVPSPYGWLEDPDTGMALHWQSADVAR